MIEVLIIDGSEPMATAVTDILNSDEDIHVIGVAKDGFEAIHKTMEYAPDVVMLNLELRGMDGIEVIQELTKVNPVPIVLFSELDEKHSETLTNSWFEEIVVEYIYRPAEPARCTNRKEEILLKVKSASDSHLRKILPRQKLTLKRDPTKDKIVVIAASSGGPPTISYILRSLPKNIPCPVIIVQHMPKRFTAAFANRLDNICDLQVKEAEAGEILKNGVVYVAPGDYHLELERTFGSDVHIVLSQSEKELGVRPSANVTMRTAAMIYKDSTIGIVLTGMGKDGTKGAKFIKRHFGTIIIESKKSCIVYGMPGSILKSGYYDLVLNLEDIPPALVQMLEI